MLASLLALLEEGNTYSQYDLALQLGVNADTVGAQIEYLARTGYLRRASMGEVCQSGTCQSCGMRCKCGRADFITGPVMWRRAV